MIWLLSPFLCSCLASYTMTALVLVSKLKKKVKVAKKLKKSSTIVLEHGHSLKFYVTTYVDILQTLGEKRCSRTTHSIDRQNPLCSSERRLADLNPARTQISSPIEIAPSAQLHPTRHEMSPRRLFLSQAFHSIGLVCRLMHLHESPYIIKMPVGGMVHWIRVLSPSFMVIVTVFILVDRDQVCIGQF